MIEGLVPYATPRRVDLPWATSIPAHWDLRRTKTVLRERVQKGFPHLPLLAATQSKGVVAKTEYALRTVVATKDLHLLKLVEPGDFVISLRSFQGGIEISHARGIISPAYTILSPRDESTSGYLRYFFKSAPFIDALTLFVKGIREGQNIDYERLSRAELPLPPPDEQSAILRFLGHANQRLDRFIRSKKKLIALLEEQKQAIVHRAVTLGLRAEGGPVCGPAQYRRVETAQGRIPWLTRIPAQWEVVPARRVFEPRKELARDGDEQLSATQAYGVIPQAEYERRVGRRVVKIFMHLEKRRHVERDDFVISMRSFQGGLERSWASGCIRSSYVVLRPRVPVDTGFFAYLFKSPGYIGALQATASFIRDGQDLNFDNFRMVDLPVPPLPEQRAIAGYLDARTSALTRTIDKTRRQLQLIVEYRSRLIADVVTGQLDVREVASALPAHLEDAAGVADTGDAFDETGETGVEDA